MRVPGHLLLKEKMSFPSLERFEELTPERSLLMG